MPKKKPVRRPKKPLRKPKKPIRKVKKPAPSQKLQAGPSPKPTIEPMLAEALMLESPSHSMDPPTESP